MDIGNIMQDITTNETVNHKLDTLPKGIGDMTLTCQDRICACLFPVQDIRATWYLLHGATSGNESHDRKKKGIFSYIMRANSKPLIRTLIHTHTHICVYIDLEPTQAEN